MKRSVLMLAVFVALADAQAQNIVSYKKDLKVEQLTSRVISPEAVAVSDDGNQVVYIAKTPQDFDKAPPTKAFIIKKTGASWSAPMDLPWGGMVTSVSFGNKDQWLVVTKSYGTFEGYMQILKHLFGDREQIGNLPGFNHRIEIYNASQPSELLFDLDSNDFTLTKPEMLKHARVSPSGQWLTFYTHGVEGQQGIYVYEFQARKTYHLGLSDDKHPTWTPDGSKILFHQQIGGNAFVDYGKLPERSRIGYYSLDSKDGNFRATRTMLDPETQGFVYHKHPTVYPGTDIMFFHASLEVDGGKKLMARRLKPNSRLYKISDVEFGKIGLKGAKHGSTSLSPTGLYFVGRREDAPKTEPVIRERTGEYLSEVDVELRDIYQIPNDEIQKFIQSMK